jgi:hypothetical protein
MRPPPVYMPKSRPAECVILFKDGVTVMFGPAVAGVPPPPPPPPHTSSVTAPGS